MQHLPNISDAAYARRQGIDDCILTPFDKLTRQLDDLAGEAESADEIFPEDREDIFDLVSLARTYIDRLERAVTILPDDNDDDENTEDEEN
jgi:hypothetical protein